MRFATFVLTLSLLSLKQRKQKGVMFYNKKRGLSYIKKRHKKKSPKTFVSELSSKRRRLPTLPHCIAVPSALVGLTSLFGMGRGGTPPQ